MHNVYQNAYLLHKLRTGHKERDKGRQQLRADLSGRMFTFPQQTNSAQEAASDRINLAIRNSGAVFRGQDYRLNTWHSVCATWDSASGVGQMWLDGKPSSRKFISSGSDISGPIIIVLGQEQDSHGGGFDINQSFVGMLSDIHMWDHTLLPCQIQNYEDYLTFTAGNLLNWRTLEFLTKGRVLIEDKHEPYC
uniref:C-reactive protein-like isoform X4 n=1 Tax=Epinephelus lanceolatus TaxID=310571 RepID=UPI0014455F35|nr:C-reactive protein-like isoform X4 [Epinephelus lanceolatus]